MSLASIPEDIRRFILTSVPSVPFLEALLLLRNEANRPWDAKQLATRLYISEKIANELLLELHAARFLSVSETSPPLFSYSPHSDELDGMVGQVAETYSKNIVDVTNLIHSNVSKQAQQFADAFKWRKDS
jgi:hypothetical protein